jgi:hypothetical protein
MDNRESRILNEESYTFTDANQNQEGKITTQVVQIFEQGNDNVGSVFIEATYIGTITLATLLNDLLPLAYNYIEENGLSENWKGLLLVLDEDFNLGLSVNDDLSALRSKAKKKKNTFNKSVNKILEDAPHLLLLDKSNINIAPAFINIILRLNATKSKPQKAESKQEAIEIFSN